MTVSDADLLSGSGERESVEVVLVESTAAGLVPMGGGPVVDPTGEHPPTADALGALLDASLTLSSPYGLDSELVRAIQRSAVPLSFQRSPWLLAHRMLVFANGECRIGPHLVRYEKHLGVHMEPAEPPLPEATSSARAAPRPRTAVDSHPTAFDLRNEPWVPVVWRTGATGQVGLLRLFTHAHEIRRISGETPPMTAALHRLALALFHRAYGPESEAAWASLWQESTLPSDPLGEYLDRMTDRFDLFHPTMPFFQCPALAALTPATPGKLVPHRAVGNNVTLFDHTTSGDVVTLSPAEAARWLVTVQAFDPGGMKTPFERDKSSERAPCNDFGVVLVEGANLKQTLLLNTVVYRPEAELPRMTTPRDAPAWEQEPPAPYPDRRTAHGWTDLLTWPSRRVLLASGDVGDRTVVTGVTLTPGTRLDVVPPDEELMAAYRRPSDKSGRPKRDAPMLPVRLRPVRGVWRHSVELLITDAWQEDRHRQRPPALDQIANLAERGHVNADTVHTLRVFGQQLDAKASVVEAWLEEEVPAPVALLRARDESLGALIGAAIAYADEAGSALRALQSDFRKDMRATPATDIERWYWPHLPRPFAAFLRGLGEARVVGRPETGAAEAWRDAVDRLARSSAERWVVGPLPAARAVLTLGKHHARFLGRLAKVSNEFLVKVRIYSSEKVSTDA